MSRVGVRAAPAIVRLKLAATATVATILAIVITALTVQTMLAARDTDMQAHHSYERMSSLWSLQDAAKRLQTLRFKASRFEGNRADPEVSDARRAFDSALTQVLGLPRRSVHEAEFARRLQTQAAAVLELVERQPEIARRMESLWQTAGYKAALAELTDISVPYDTLFRSIGAEIAMTGQQFSEATQRAAVRQGVVRTMAFTILVLGLLMAVTLFFALLKRLALQKANVALAAEDERRRTFFVDASHELRIPITIIRGEAQVALRQETGARSETLEALERILEQTRSVTRILDDLFLIARAEAGGLHMNLQRVDAGAVAKHTASDFSTLACESGATVLCEAQADLYVVADPDRLRQALAALIDNALRHTCYGVTVVVAAKADGDGVLLTVSDDGPGIDPGLAGELFQRFRRGRSPGEGSGLGLAVVRALAEAFGGTASIDTAASGARFCLRLPRAPSATAQSRGEARELTAAG